MNNWNNDFDFDEVEEAISNKKQPKIKYTNMHNEDDFYDLGDQNEKLKLPSIHKRSHSKFKKSIQVKESWNAHQQESQQNVNPYYHRRKQVQLKQIQKQKQKQKQDQEEQEESQQKSSDQEGSNYDDDDNSSRKQQFFQQQDQQHENIQIKNQHNIKLSKNDQNNETVYPDTDKKLLFSQLSYLQQVQKTFSKYRNVNDMNPHELQVCNNKIRKFLKKINEDSSILMEKNFMKLSKKPKKANLSVLDEIKLLKQRKKNNKCKLEMLEKQVNKLREKQQEVKGSKFGMNIEQEIDKLKDNIKIVEKSIVSIQCCIATKGKKLHKLQDQGQKNGNSAKNQIQEINSQLLRSKKEEKLNEEKIQNLNNKINNLENNLQKAEYIMDELIQKAKNENIGFGIQSLIKKVKELKNKKENIIKHRQKIQHLLKIKRDRIVQKNKQIEKVVQNIEIQIEKMLNRIKNKQIQIQKAQIKAKRVVKNRKQVQQIKEMIKCQEKNDDKKMIKKKQQSNLKDRIRSRSNKKYLLKKNITSQAITSARLNQSQNDIVIHKPMLIEKKSKNRAISKKSNTQQNLLNKEINNEKLHVKKNGLKDDSQIIEVYNDYTKFILMKNPKIREKKIEIQDQMKRIKEVTQKKVQKVLQNTKKIEIENIIKMKKFQKGRMKIKQNELIKNKNKNDEIKITQNKVSKIQQNDTKQIRIQKNIQQYENHNKDQLKNNEQLRNNLIEKQLSQLQQKSQERKSQQQQQQQQQQYQQQQQQQYQQQQQQQYQQQQQKQQKQKQKQKQKQNSKQKQQKQEQIKQKSQKLQRQQKDQLKISQNETIEIPIAPKRVNLRNKIRGQKIDQYLPTIKNDNNKLNCSNQELNQDKYKYSFNQYKISKLEQNHQNERSAQIIIHTEEEQALTSKPKFNLKLKNRLKIKQNNTQQISINEMKQQQKKLRQNELNIDNIKIKNKQQFIKKKQGPLKKPKLKIKNQHNNNNNNSINIYQQAQDILAEIDNKNNNNYNVEIIQKNDNQDISDFNKLLGITKQKNINHDDDLLDIITAAPKKNSKTLHHAHDFFEDIDL